LSCVSIFFACPSCDSSHIIRAAMPTTEEYKQSMLALLDAFYEVTKEHIAMSEVLRRHPGLVTEYRIFLPQSHQAVDSAFGPLRRAIESGIDFRHELAELSKLPSSVSAKKASR